MKKLFAIILATLYVFTSSGATIELHYCMGKLTDQTFMGNESNMCSKCPMQKVHKAKDCCQTQTKQLKIDNGHYVLDLYSQSAGLNYTALPVTFVEIPSLFSNSSFEDFTLFDDFPRSPHLALFKQNGVFRI
ncbi:MAG: hypothetical protein J0H55_01970 [Chitinophagaceae bacterium]|nr:hypothetical protein [Chitinophagaceae bacterium]